MNYKTEDIWCHNGADRIYGVAYVPDLPGRMPLIIFAHEFGNDHTAGDAYAKHFVKKGFAFYEFDFRGGSASPNRSDGSSLDMSVMTEAEDLGSVIKEAQAWPFVDPTQIIVLGGSQGGCAAAIETAQHPDEIAGLMLIYPAFMIPDNNKAMYSSADGIPNSVQLLDGWMTVGKNYFIDTLDYDLYAHIGALKAPVLILHGDKDTVVPLSYSKRAAAVYPNCTLHMITEGGHGFFGSAQRQAKALMDEWLEAQGFLS